MTVLPAESENASAFYCPHKLTTDKCIDKGKIKVYDYSHDMDYTMIMEYHTRNIMQDLGKNLARICHDF